jgi:hypothetical protein
MKLPYGHSAIITDEKLIGYVLNPDHPVHGGHAVLFKRLLDIDQSNVEILRAALAEAAREGDARPGKASQYGEKYEICSPMTGERGKYTILSVWIIETGELVPRLVTAFVE